MSRRIPALMRRGGRGVVSGGGGGGAPALDYLYTPANIPLNGTTQFEVLPVASVDSRLWNGEWTIRTTLGASYATTVEHLIHASTTDARILTLSTGNLRWFVGGNARTITRAAMGSPNAGDEIVISLSFVTGAWTVSVNGGAPVAGPPHAAGVSWVAADLQLCTTNGSSSSWSGTTVYPAIGSAPEMPATLLSFWAEDYDTGTNTWPNRGSLGSLGDLALVGAAPTKGTDATGPFVDFTATTGYMESATFTTSYAGSDFTIYTLFDVAATNGFIFDFAKLGARLTLRSETTRTRILDSAYRNYGTAGVGNPHYEAYVLDGATPEGLGYLVDDVADANNPNIYAPQIIDTANLTIGALGGGSTPHAGKVRAISIAGAAHNGALRAQAQAAHETIWTL